MTPGAAVENSRQHLDIALGKSFWRPPLEIGGRDALAVFEFSAPRIVAGYSAILVKAAVDLERSQGPALIAYDRPGATGGLDDVQGSPKRIRWRRVAGGAERQEKDE
jgi:hypothetical protein